MPCICVSVVHITDSHSNNPKHVFNDKKSGVAQYIKYIEGIHHPVKGERLQSIIHAVFNVPQMHAQIRSGALTFSTRTGALEDDGICFHLSFSVCNYLLMFFSGNTSSNRFAGTSSSKLFVQSPRKKLDLDNTGVPKTSLSVNDIGV